MVAITNVDAQEALEPLADIVGKPIAVEDGDDVVGVGGEGSF
jgi:hypothetical protein